MFGAVATPLFHRGRLIDHVHLVVADVEASKRFYLAALGVLGIPLCGEGPDYFWADELFVSSAQSKAAAGKLTGRVHLAFQAGSRDQVEEFYRAGLAAGGVEHGAPGERPYHPGYFGAFLLDPDGNNIEAVFHGPGKRSAASVTIEIG
jgi:catechol 2,3-dioxygenase-like lactoylglutathione lyase family enzyme